MIRVLSQYVSLKTLFLMALESALAAMCLACAARLRFWNSPDEFAAYATWTDFGPQILVCVLVFQVCFYYNEMYDLGTPRSRADLVLRLGEGLGAACLLLGVLYYFVPATHIGRGVFFIGVGLFAISSGTLRLTLDAAWRATGPAQHILILGAGELAATIGRELTLRPDLHVKVSFLRNPNHPDPSDFFGHPVLGTFEDLDKVASEHRLSRIIVAIEDCRGVMPVRSLVNLRVKGIQVEEAHTALAGLTGRVWLRTVRPSWFVYSEGFRRSRLTLAVKRILDLVCGMAGLILSGPIMAMVAAAVRLDSKGPALYRQVRVGWRGKEFEVLKFRSMRTDAEAPGKAQWAQQEDPRVTRVGRFIRKYRLDELPQFVNVIRGDMSFVGPRPERPVFVKELRESIPYYDERHSVRPGLTGWAQVQYAYGASVEDSHRKLEYDLFYLKNMSLMFDLLIIVQTIKTVLFGRGSR